MKIDFESLIERFTKNLTPTKIVLGLLALIIVLAVINTLVSLATSLLPIAILGVAGYFGYQWLNSRTDEMMENRKAKKEAKNDEAEALAEDAIKQEAQRREDDNVADAARNLSVEAQDEENESNVLLGAVLNKGDGMKIPQRINPKTGLPEADISRLEQAEQESIEITDSVLAQLAERRKRLLGEEEG